MSNIIRLDDAKIKFAPDEIDASELRRLLESACESTDGKESLAFMDRTTTWWYLQKGTSFKVDGSVEIDLNEARSSHSTRSLVATLCLLSRFLYKKVDRKIDGQAFKMDPWKGIIEPSELTLRLSDTMLTVEHDGASTHIFNFRKKAGGKYSIVKMDELTTFITNNLHCSWEVR